MKDYLINIDVEKLPDGVIEAMLEVFDEMLGEHNGPLYLFIFWLYYMTGIQNNIKISKLLSMSCTTKRKNMPPPKGCFSISREGVRQVIKKVEARIRKKYQEMYGDKAIVSTIDFSEYVVHAPFSDGGTDEE